MALAADSAVTFGTPNRTKIYNTVNKLFALSKFEPVGIMVYGSAELLGVPWETIIKRYRVELGEVSFSRLEEYAQAFFAYLDAPHEFFPEDVQTQYFLTMVQGYFNEIRTEIDSTVESEIQRNGAITEEGVAALRQKVIERHFKTWQDHSFPISSLPKEWADEVIKRFKDDIEAVKARVFQRHFMSPDESAKLLGLARYMISHNRFSSSHSGIVIAGFGEKDTFPVVEAFVIEGFVGNRLKYIRNESGCARIDHLKTNAAILPYAQTDDAIAFISGASPAFMNSIQGAMEGFVEQYPAIVTAQLPDFSPEKKAKLSQQLKSEGEKALRAALDRLAKHQGETHIHPILNVVSALPKDELAVMAESLVHLTSLKRKFSLSAETVGGPVDVAVISKGDGLVWIKRKHYFDVRFNPHFIQNYYRDVNRGEYDQ